jgi:hypothetical protein
MEIEVRRLGPGDEAMRLYASVGGVRPDYDVVMWDFAWSARR